MSHACAAVDPTVAAVLTVVDVLSVTVFSSCLMCCCQLYCVAAVLTVVDVPGVLLAIVSLLLLPPLMLLTSLLLKCSCRRILNS